MFTSNGLTLYQNLTVNLLAIIKSGILLKSTKFGIDRADI